MQALVLFYLKYLIWYCLTLLRQKTYNYYLKYWTQKQKTEHKQNFNSDLDLVSQNLSIYYKSRIID